MSATGSGYLPALPSVPLIAGAFGYIGCFTNSSEAPFCDGLESLNNTNMSVDWCKDFCQDFNAFGLGQGTDCKKPPPPPTPPPTFSILTNCGQQLNDSHCTVLMNLS